jgi:hypothetical protein
MPLPDANKKSPRVYTNLQNLDLDTVTFANIQSTGNPIAVEELNEDEMRRLVLVNLARLVTAGEWTGLLEAGGGGSVLGVGAGVKTGAVYSTLTKQGPFGRGSPDTTFTWNANAAHYFPFIAPLTATIDTVIVNVTGASASADMLMCVYNSDADTGAPTSQLSDEVAVECSSTGYIQTDFSSPPEVEVGKLYYFGMARDAADNIGLRCHITAQETNFGGQEYAGDYNRNALTETGVDNTLPATATAANVLGANLPCPMIEVKWSTT